MTGRTALTGMITHTFCHIPGIGIRTERQWWDLGVHTWDDFNAGARERLPLGRERVRKVSRCLDQSFAGLENRDIGFFVDLLPSDQHWRLFREFRSEAAYLDIETTGMGTPGDHITTIALYDGQTIRWYVHGVNLDQFRNDILNHRLIVTYNGKCFDIPFIRNTLGVPMDQVHIDLRYVLAGLGYRGGLKGCERQLGISRSDLDGVDGFFAVLLWEEFLRNRNRKALETLLAYNILDAVNLEALAVFCYNAKAAGTPFAQALQLPMPTPPNPPFSPDRETIDTIRTRWARTGFWA